MILVLGESKKVGIVSCLTLSRETFNFLPKNHGGSNIAFYHISHIMTESPVRVKAEPLRSRKLSF